MQTNEKLSQQYISLFNLFIYVILIIYLSNVFILQVYRSYTRILLNLSLFHVF